jgi:hypothetical protein
MGPILDLIESIRKQPGLMIGRKSISTLEAFLAGFAFARKDDKAAGDYEFLADFNDWVHERFGVQSTQGWARIIAFYSADENDELPLFWRLLDEYRESRLAKQTRAAVKRPKAREHGEAVS